MVPEQEQIGKDVPNRPKKRERSAVALFVMMLLLALLGLGIFALSSVWPHFEILSPTSTTIDIEQHK